MEVVSQISEFGKILIFIIAGAVFVAGGFITSWLLRPSRPNPEKLTTYECGEDPVGNSWLQFNIRFYVVALIFIIFDVEIIFLFPWATIFDHKEIVRNVPGWSVFAFIEMLIFIGILFLGLVYAWIKGDLSWVKPQGYKSEFAGKIPEHLYQSINNTVYEISRKPAAGASPVSAVAETV